MIVTTLNYHDYFYTQLKVMLTSLSINSPKDLVKIVLADFPETEVEKLKKKFPNYIFENRMLGTDKMKSKKIASLMVCYRSVVTLECLKEGHDKVAWFDVDLIIRKDLSSMWEQVTPETLMIQKRKTERLDSKFQAGVMVVGNSDITTKYISEWNDVIQNDSYWISEQKNLWIVYQKLKDKLNFVDMGIMYNDVGSSKTQCFLEDTYIWHSKKKHFNNPKFQKEFQHYLKEYENG